MNKRLRQVLLEGLWLALMGALVAGCSAHPLYDGGGASRAASAPDTHTVRRGESLYRIADRYGLEWRELARRNGIGSPYTIYPGQELRLRGSAVASRPSSASPSSSPTASGSSPEPSSEASSSRSPETSASPDSDSETRPAASAPQDDSGGDGDWQWPVTGDILRSFSDSATRRGIAIAGERGDPVRAARGGEVVYAGGGLVGYGRLVILKHDSRYLSAYGHNDELLVAEGDRVEAGDTIARMGSSGTDRTMLHFEIRRDGTPVDPGGYLPGR